MKNAENRDRWTGWKELPFSLRQTERPRLLVMDLKPPEGRRETPFYLRLKTSLIRKSGKVSLCYSSGDLGVERVVLTAFPWHSPPLPPGATREQGGGGGGEVEVGVGSIPNQGHSHVGSVSKAGL